MSTARPPPATSGRGARAPLQKRCTGAAWRPLVARARRCAPPRKERRWARRSVAQGAPATRVRRARAPLEGLPQRGIIRRRGRGA
eukprot:15454564-Alexandrium_andersonii.AAC.1